jgi:hypothetical protein
MSTPVHKLIAEAQSNFPDELIIDVMDACEAFYRNGSYDEVTGDVDTIGHFYRIDRFIVETDSRGFSICNTYNTVWEAEEEMRRMSELHEEDR